MARNPQVSVSLDPEYLSALKRVAALSGTSVSGLIGDVLAAQRPFYFQLADVLERASRLSEAHSTRLQARLGDLLQDTEEVQAEMSDALDQLDMAFIEEATDQEWALGRARAQRKRPARVRASAKEPPVFNKGVTIPDGSTK